MTLRRTGQWIAVAVVVIALIAALTMSMLAAAKLGMPSFHQAGITSVEPWDIHINTNDLCADGFTQFCPSTHTTIV